MTTIINTPKGRMRVIANYYGTPCYTPSCELCALHNQGYCHEVDCQAYDTTEYAVFLRPAKPLVRLNHLKRSAKEGSEL